MVLIFGQNRDYKSEWFFIKAMAIIIRRGSGDQKGEDFFLSLSLSNNINVKSVALMISTLE